MSYLELVSCELSVVPEHLVVTGPTGALDALVAQQVEISLQDKDNQEDKPASVFTSVGWLIPWSTTVPARAFPFLYWLLSAGKNLREVTIETNLTES